MIGFDPAFVIDLLCDIAWCLRDRKKKSKSKASKKSLIKFHTVFKLHQTKAVPAQS